jgi:DnaJ-class molecular chaperone
MLNNHNGRNGRNLESKVECPACNGSRNTYDSYFCPICQGTGFVEPAEFKGEFPPKPGYEYSIERL